MSTYDQLRDRSLNQVQLLGASDAQIVAQIALEEAMKYVAFNVRVPSLIGSATATAPANASLEASAIDLGASGFNISSSFQCVDRLYVKKDSSTAILGTPYEYEEYNIFQDLKAVPSANRHSVFCSATSDERPRYSYTITPAGKLWAQPLTQNNVLTLFFRKVPAPYSGNNTPEILAMFDWILVNAAVLALKEWLREPEAITSLWMLFDQYLKADVEKYSLFLKGQRKRTHLKIHRSYRPWY